MCVLTQIALPTSGDVDYDKLVCSNLSAQDLIDEPYPKPNH